MKHISSNILLIDVSTVWNRQLYDTRNSHWTDSDTNSRGVEIHSHTRRL